MVSGGTSASRRIGAVMPLERSSMPSSMIATASEFGAAHERRLRREFGAVSVAVGLDDGAEETVADDRLDRPDVVRDGRG